MKKNVLLKKWKMLTIILGVLSIIAWRYVQAADPNIGGGTQASFVDVSTDTKTIAGEPLEYPSTPNPVIFSNVVTIPPGTVTPWMVHPVPAYVYILEGTLTVEFGADGSLHKFNAGQAFLQARTHWHRGRNDGTTPVRFLGVFVGSKDVPVILHPPSSKSAQE